MKFLPLFVLISFGFVVLVGGSVSTVVSGRKAPVVRTPPTLPSGLGQTHKKAAQRKAAGGK